MRINNLCSNLPCHVTKFWPMTYKQKWYTQLLESIIKGVRTAQYQLLLPLTTELPSFLQGNYPAPHSPTTGFCPSPAPRWDMWPRPKPVTILNSQGPVSGSQMDRRSKTAKYRTVKNGPDLWDQSGPSIMPALNLGKWDTGMVAPLPTTQTDSFWEWNPH